MTIRVMLADDHAVVRQSLRLLLERQKDVEVVGECDNGYDAVAQVLAAKPDVLVMDISMPELSGIEATRQLCAAWPQVRVIILSMHSTLSHVARALHAGARGFVLKSSDSMELMDAIRTVAAGGRYLSPELSIVVADAYGSRSLAQDPIDYLSPREREVMQLVVDGASSQEIAVRLGLSINTVDTYRSRLKTKLGVDNMADLVKFAIRHELISY
jgi:DNA-binding NarL/FixJ family response regulator